MRADDLRARAHRLETTFAGRCAREFIALQGFDRALVLASQAFTALIPLLLLVSALAPADDRDIVARALIGRFRLTGDAADAVRQLFTHSGSGAVGVLSGFLLVFSGVSLTRRMQRMYQQTWQVRPRPGVVHAAHAALGLAALVLGIALLYMARALVDQLPVSGVLLLLVSVAASFVLWTTIPWLLLDRRLAWRRLVPGGLLTTACTTAYGVATTIYMPGLLETYSRRYGLFGVTLALVGWLLCIAFIVVAATTVAAELNRTPDLWAQRVQGRLGAAPAGPGPAGPQADTGGSVSARPAPDDVLAHGRPGGRDRGSG